MPNCILKRCQTASNNAKQAETGQLLPVLNYLEWMSNGTSTTLLGTKLRLLAALISPEIQSEFRGKRTHDFFDLWFHAARNKSIYLPDSCKNHNTPLIFSLRKPHFYVNVFRQGLWLHTISYDECAKENYEFQIVNEARFTRQNSNCNDGVSRLGLGLETSLETHFCESRPH